jgi:hypothetical protein
VIFIENIYLEAYIGVLGHIIDLLSLSAGVKVDHIAVINIRHWNDIGQVIPGQSQPAKPDPGKECLAFILR